MLSLTRRRFLQGSAVTAGALAAHRWLFGGLETLARADPLAQGPPVEDMFPTTCWIGKQDCGMLARRIDGRVVKFEGHPGNPRNAGTLCPKGQAQIVSIYDPNRVKTPLVRTNAKGQKGEFRPTSWDEAITMIADQVNEVRARNPKLVLWQKGRSKAKDFYDDAFVKSIGCSKLGHGAYCSDAGYRALEYTIGLHGVQHPDFQNVDYLLAWGWNITNAGGNKFCWLTWPRQMVVARERGMKIVHIDPRLRSAGPFADKWLPIKPGTDLALALALCHELVNQGYVDTEYLTNYTNGPHLVGEDGLFLTETVGEGDEAEQVPIVWSASADGPVRADQASQAKLDGTYEIDGATYRTAYQAFTEHLAQYDPDWAEVVCGLDAQQIRQVAREFGEHARIGSTTVVDGVQIPYRPVSIMSYHMAQQELGFQALRAMTYVAMLVGAVGAVGGMFSDFEWKIHKNYAAFEELTVGDPPYDYMLNKSKYFPINTGFPGVVAKVMLDPERYEVEELPEVCILHMVNPVAAFPGQAEIMASYEKFRFVAAITPWLSETADYYADVVLPAATIEKYEGVISASDGILDAKTLRLPPMEPLFESRGEIDIYLDLTEAIGTLFGDDGYLAVVNSELKLEGEFALPLDRKPTPREIFDRWARSQGLEGGIEYFERNGVWVKGLIPPEKRYGYAADPPFGGALHRIYGASLLAAQRQMQSKGADEIYWRDYTALPTWRAPTMESSPAEYDLYLISYHMIEHKQSRTGMVPLLNELAPHQRVDMCPRTARRIGVAEGDEVWVESHNAVTAETRRVKTVVALTEGIRPDTVAMPHHYGLWSVPESSDRGPTPNAIYPTGEGYMANTADQSFHVKVRVYPANGGDEA